MVDIGLAAFSMFFMQCESFLSYQRRLEEVYSTSNCLTLFGIRKVPTNPLIRGVLDEVPADFLQPCFDLVLEEMERRNGLEVFQRLGGRTLIALDGTEYFCSQKLSCPQCQKRERSNGKTEFYHALLAATVVAPGHNQALPLMPEFIAPQDGAAKQDCERNAAKRWLTAHGQQLKSLRPIYLGDALFSCQPLAEAVLATGADFLFVCKQDNHKTLYEFLQGVELEQHTVTERIPGKPRRVFRYDWMNGVPLRDGKDALPVQWIGVTVTDAAGKTTYNGAFVTSLPVARDTVAEIAACARARWKIENEGFNVLKNNGYKLEHNFGHGKKHLAQLFVVMNLLAFAFHTVCDCMDLLWQRARKRATRSEFFQKLRILTAYTVFLSWNAFLKSIAPT